MTNITNTLIANITATDDTTSNVIINKGTGNPAYDSTGAAMTEYVTLAAGATNIQGVIGVITTMIYIRNVDPNGKLITVIWTPNGGASATVIVLNPGDQIILWQKPGGTNAGITQLSLTPSAAGALVEYFVGG